MLSLISVPGLKKLAIFTSTLIFCIPIPPNKTKIMPPEKVWTGNRVTILPKKEARLSSMLGLAMELLSGFQEIILIIAGSVNELSIQAQAIPTDMHIPYPINGSNGELIMVKNADMVVILVKNIGTNRDSIAYSIAVFTFFNLLNSRKNFVMT